MRAREIRQYRFNLNALSGLDNENFGLNVGDHAERGRDAVKPRQSGLSSEVRNSAHIRGELEQSWVLD